jgi:copper homeostasis protein
LSARVLLEIAIEGPDEVELAESGGADRLELCQALDLGGLTPSPGLVSATVVVAEVPVVAMIRPRPGDFVYSKREIDALRRDVDLVGASGVAGVVLGCLRADGEVDLELTASLVERARPVPVTFHRAFDSVQDAGLSLEGLIEIGVTRVLTAGTSDPRGALAGIERLAELVERAGTRIEILAGGGVRAAHAAQLVSQAGLSALHAGPRRPFPGLASSTVAFGRRTTVDTEAVQALRASLNDA